VKLDPEERIIAAALDQAELDDANERGAGARIEFKREGYAKVTITISRGLVEQARALDLTTGELFAEAIRLAVPRTTPTSCQNPGDPAPSLRGCAPGRAGAALSRTIRPAALRFPGGSDHILQGVEVEDASDDVIGDNEARCSVNI
jgi:hypothetical protein